jgi:hypothetical protein
MIREFFVQTLRAPRYDNRKFFAMFLILMVSLNVDAAIANNADILSKFVVTFWGISLFIIIAAIFVFGQFYVLAMVRAKNKESQFKPHNANQLEKLMTAFQYSFAVIMVIVVLQIVSTNHYYTHFLTLSIVTSYCLTVFFMSLLAYKLFSWFKLNRRIVVLCYGLAAALIVVNAVDSIILNVVPLLGKPPMVSPQSLVIFQTGYSPGTAMSVVTWIQSNSVLGYIILTWLATIFLLRAHMRRVGRIKFWVLVILPLVYFMSYNLSLYQSLYPNSPVTTVTSSSVLIPLLLLVFATTLCGILFGIGFWAVSRFLRRGSDVRDYMIITAFGLALFFTAADAGLLQAGA